MDDVTAGRQHDVRGGAALLADQLERAGVVGLVGEHPPHQPAIDDRQILAVARRQRQHRLAWNRGTLAALPAGRAIDGGTMVGWFSGAECSESRRSPRAAPDSWPARSGASGTEAGGTGGGRSWNIWAEAGAGSMAEHQGSRKASASPGKAIRPARIHRCRYPRDHGHAFHRKRGKFKPPCASSAGGDWRNRPDTQC